MSLSAGLGSINGVQEGGDPEYNMVVSGIDGSVTFWEESPEHITNMGYTAYGAYVYEHSLTLPKHTFLEAVRTYLKYEPDALKELFFPTKG